MSKTKDISEIYGANLRKYRKEKNLSQEKLADSVNVTARFISQVETGQSFPSKQNIEMIAAVLGIPSFMFFNPSVFSDSDKQFRMFIQKTIKEEL